MIEAEQQYCHTWGLQINAEKSKVRVIKDGKGRSAQIERWQVNGQSLNTVKEIKYLGVTLTHYVSINYIKELGKNSIPLSTKCKIYWATRSRHFTFKVYFKNKRERYSRRHRLSDTRHLDKCSSRLHALEKRHLLFVPNPLTRRLGFTYAAY